MRSLAFKLFLTVVLSFGMFFIALLVKHFSLQQPGGNKSIALFANHHEAAKELSNFCRRLSN